LLCGLAASPAAVAIPDPTALGASIDNATPKKANDRDPTLVAKAEILLDRAHVSPGEIDGLDGDNFRNAVRAFQQVNRLPVSGGLDAATWGALKRDGAPCLVSAFDGASLSSDSKDALWARFCMGAPQRQSGCVPRQAFRGRHGV
jgi:peptidoglycan hydrolase-like protein with peptidoglycan-binding domain